MRSLTGQIQHMRLGAPLICDVNRSVLSYAGFDEIEWYVRNSLLIKFK